jgi:hypothetical protein
MLSCRNAFQRRRYAGQKLGSKAGVGVIKTLVVEPPPTRYPPNPSLESQACGYTIFCSDHRWGRLFTQQPFEVAHPQNFRYYTAGAGCSRSSKGLDFRGDGRVRVG